MCSPLLLYVSTSLLAAETNFDFLQELNDTEMNNYLDATNFDTHSHRDIDPDVIVSLLVETLKAQCLLENNLYLRTNTLNKKSIIDIPAFFPCLDYERKRVFGLSLFYNQTSQMFFSEKCSGIQSYLAVCDPTLLTKLSDCLDCVRTLFPQYNINPFEIFPLFANVAVQDRQVGFMLHGDKSYNNIHFHVHVPLMYHIRNFYMTEKEQERIEKAFSSIADESNEEAVCQEAQKTSSDKGIDTTQFALQHLVSDKFGIGDTRIHIDFDLFKGKLYNYGIGFVATIPTAFAFKKGLLGTDFACKTQPTNFDIGHIIDVAQNGDTDAATTIGKNFMIGALDELSSNLLDTGLGYDKHLGLGASWYTKTKLSFFFRRPWASSIKMRSRMILQYYFPAYEMRAFVENKNPADYGPLNFDLDKVNHSIQYAQDALDLINKKLVQEFYPFMLRTRVHPGIIFQWTSNAYYHSRPWKFQLTSDFWAKTEESFSYICRQHDTPQLLVDCARRPGAYQSRIGASIAYTVYRPSKEFTFSLYGDTAYASKGIGKDFSIVFNIECNF